MIELVALDMAGTTIDEHGDVYVALHDAVAAEGVDASDELVATWMGTDKREAIANLVIDGGGAPLDPAKPHEMDNRHVRPTAAAPHPDATNAARPA